MFISFIQNNLSKIGIDRAIAYSSFARIVQGAGGIFTIFFIASGLTSEEQGYYYTFSSILAIQIFFELGLGGIVTQYVAHEVIHLEKQENGLLREDQEHKSRLSSLLHLFVKWYLVISVIFFICVTIFGFRYFSFFGQGDNINWKIPWILLCLSSSINLLTSPFSSIIQGLGNVRHIALMRLVTQVLSILAVWGALLLGGKLYTPFIASFTICIASFFFIFNKFYCRIFIDLWKTTRKYFVSYKKEIFPYQWKIALSWISGYFIFQFFNPVLFAYAGAETAGQMGMTLTAINGIMALTLNWTSTKVPVWSGYIAKKDFNSLDIMFNRTVKQSTFVCSSCVIIFTFFLFIISYVYPSLYDRFLPIQLSALLAISVIINNIINAWATYLRCHKKEPFLIQAIIIGVLSALSTLILGKLGGVNGIVIGYVLIVILISLPLSYHIFKTKKNEYHG